MAYKILVVDDEEDIREIISHFLTRAGYLVDTAADGKIAFEKILAARPDLIISDIRMPNWDGYELLKNVTTITPPRIPILFISGYTFGHESQIKDNLNYAGLLSKPVTSKDLISAVQKNIT